MLPYPFVSETTDTVFVNEYIVVFHKVKKVLRPETLYTVQFHIIYVGSAWLPTYCSLCWSSDGTTNRIVRPGRIFEATTK